MSAADDWGRRQQAARESWVEIADYKVKIRCPDELDIRRIERAGEDIDEALVLRFVVDWKGITEAHLLPGVGGDEAVAFSPFAWREWIGGRGDDWNAVSKALVEAFKARRERREAVAGKSPST